MFMDFKFFDEVVQASEEQRKAAVQAWEQWVDFLEKSAETFGVVYEAKKK